MPYKTAQDLIAEAKARITEVSASDALAMRDRGEKVIFLDVRDQVEVNLGKIPGAVHISRGTMETKIEAVIPREAHVIVYCASGNRSAFAAETLQEMGYSNVASMAGGFRDWVMGGGGVE
jgi:rhodanese-related sulfurtransferase